MFYTHLKEITSVCEIAKLILIHTAASSSFSTIFQHDLFFVNFDDDDGDSRTKFFKT